MSETQNNKRALRRYLRAQRASLGAEARGRASAEIAQRLFGLAEWRAAEAVLCYLSFGDEVATDEVVRRARAEGKRLAAPRVTGPHQMEWHWLAEGDPLERSCFGILEPVGEGETLVDLATLGASGGLSDACAPDGMSASSASPVAGPAFSPAGPCGMARSHAAAASPTSGTLCTIAVVPALAFDGQCRRIGYGGGFYDAFLAGFGGRTVGLCFDALLQDDLAALGCAEPHDVSLDMVVTERGELRRAQAPNPEILA